MSSIGNNYTPFYVTDADLEPTLQDRAARLSLLSGRNILINGEMAVDQRNLGAASTVTTSGAYTVDRWVVQPVGGSVQAQRVGTPGLYSLQVTGGAGVTQVSIHQKVEAALIARKVGKTVTLSATIQASGLTSVQGQYFLPGSLDNFSTVTPTNLGSKTISASATRYSWTFTVPAGASNGMGVALIFGALTSGTVTVTDVQLEEGSTASPFEVLPLGMSLLLCQRYYIKETGILINMPPPIASNSTIYARRVHVDFPVRMRAAPSMTVNASQGMSNDSIQSWPSGFLYAGDQAAALEVNLVSYTANIEL